MPQRINPLQDYEFVVESAGHTTAGAVGNSLVVTSDGGLRIYLGKTLVGAARPGEWLRVVLRRKQASN